MNIIVIGSGVMGSGIAEQIANANFKVHLLDIVPANALDRNILAKQAIAKTNCIKPENIIPGNLEDDSIIFKSADWIIEVIIEKLELKQILYAKLEQYCSPSCIISSNTSTIPLSKLIEGRSEYFKNHFLITHFFNPPRYMPLLELVISEFTKIEVIGKITNFLDIQLGKTIIKSNDTPGFIANRIGCYWLEVALSLSIEMGISVEESDSIMSKPLGIPKTAIFGLYDLIGIDVMKLISKSLISTLNSKDDFVKSSKSHKIIEQMIENGFTGRKGKGGFYKVNKGDNGAKIKQVIDLKTGEYHLNQEIVSSITNVRELIDNNQYALKVLSKTLSYAASLIPEVTSNLSDIDQAMKLGYNWKYGPFELMDLIGAAYFRAKLEQQNIEVPTILAKLKDRSFYQKNSYFNGVSYTEIYRPEGIILLQDYQKQIPICQNNSAKIWDIGDDVAAIEFTSKMAMADHDVFYLIIEFFAKYVTNFKAVVIANNQANFSVGGNLKFMLTNANNPLLVDEYLKLGQTAMLALKYSPIPVVSVLKGMALGGGSELLLHSSAIVAHIETNSGLVEAGAGLIPSWGGCKEMILRSTTSEELIVAFKNIITGKISSSAYELQAMLKLDQCKIVMNINRLLFESKALALTLKNQPKPNNISTQINWEKVISELNLTGYDQILAQELISLFTMNNPNEQELLEQERKIFIKLLGNKLTQERINYMLETGKRLKN